MLIKKNRLNTTLSPKGLVILFLSFTIIFSAILLNSSFTDVSRTPDLQKRASNLAPAKDIVDYVNNLNLQPLSYRIYTDQAGNVYARNEADFTIEYNSTDADYVFSSVCSKGGTVLVSKGIYYGTSLYLTNPAVRLIGEGEGSVLLFTEGISVTNTSESYHLEISNLQLIGTGYQNIGLTLNGASRIVSFNLIIQNYYAGVYILSAPNAATIFNNFYSLISHNNNVGVYIRRNPGDDVLAHNTFFGGSIVTNHQYGVLIEGLVTNDVFQGVEIENNYLAQVKLHTLDPGMVPEGETFTECYLEPHRENPTAPFIEFSSDPSTNIMPWGNIFRENKFACVGDSTLTLPKDTIFIHNYITGGPVTFTIVAAEPGCNVDGNINPTEAVNVVYVGTGNTGRIMQISGVTLTSSSSWIDLGTTFPSGPVISVSVTGNDQVIDAWAYQIEPSRFYLVMIYSNGEEVTTPVYVTWIATLNFI